MGTFPRDHLIVWLIDWLIRPLSSHKTRNFCSMHWGCLYQLACLFFRIWSTMFIRLIMPSIFLRWEDWIYSKQVCDCTPCLVSIDWLIAVKKILISIPFSQISPQRFIPVRELHPQWSSPCHRIFRAKQPQSPNLTTGKWSSSCLHPFRLSPGQNFKSFHNGWDFTEASSLRSVGHAAKFPRGTAAIRRAGRCQRAGGNFTDEPTAGENAGKSRHPRGGSFERTSTYRNYYTDFVFNVIESFRMNLACTLLRFSRMSIDWACFWLLDWLIDAITFDWITYYYCVRLMDKWMNSEYRNIYSFLCILFIPGRHQKSLGRSRHHRPRHSTRATASIRRHPTGSRAPRTVAGSPQRPPPGMAAWTRDNKPTNFRHRLWPTHRNVKAHHSAPGISFKIRGIKSGSNTFALRFSWTEWATRWFRFRRDSVFVPKDFGVDCFYMGWNVLW